MVVGAGGGGSGRVCADNFVGAVVISIGMAAFRATVTSDTSMEEGGVCLFLDFFTACNISLSSPNPSAPPATVLFFFVLPLNSSRRFLTNSCIIDFSRCFISVEERDLMLTLLGVAGGMLGGPGECEGRGRVLV